MTETIGNWDGISAWWTGEVADDPVYREDVSPMFDRLLRGTSGAMLDLGCGEGQWLRRLDVSDGVFGTDASQFLLTQALTTAPVARSLLPNLRWVQGATIGTAVSLFVLELIEDHALFFAETARIVANGGSLVVIFNHPVFTAPESGPFMDPDLDVFWRWGDYLRMGSSEVPAGSGTVVMHHRSVAEILTTAAQAGWMLDEMIEAPLGPSAIEREPSYAGQEGIPRFFGARWHR